ncbi:hypothetical protein FIU87_19440 [Bacillus sp. THAF10]|uniref:hypothetical protein n=1 Tax=Bacillus sp. THAF10 TaxID=2587848 RepID=UPI00126857BC|nr:hypothetical protein [Bacillus sp. THAF10]QFT90824.1 hypothetical protein FIU87_19440 [Bacillus sp. THAF10]
MISNIFTTTILVIVSLIAILFWFTIGQALIKNSKLKGVALVLVILSAMLKLIEDFILRVNNGVLTYLSLIALILSLFLFLFSFKKFQGKEN